MCLPQIPKSCIEILKACKHRDGGGLLGGSGRRLVLDGPHVATLVLVEGEAHLRRPAPEVASIS